MEISKGSSGSSFQGPGDMTFIAELEKYIQTNLNNDQFGVDSLARLAGMSRSSIHRKLNKTVGIPTSQFIREYRLRRAFEILRNEDVTASEVAYQVGFSSATYFNTCFHKFYGFTPGEAKLKDSIEVKKFINIENTTIRKNSIIKRTLWGALFVLVLFSSTFFFLNFKANEDGEIIKREHIIDDKSIAVLPFKNWTGNPDLEYISDGMTDAVISRLTKISAINKVIPFTSTLT
ncbi:MAG: helix-turn-helix domain-containing protein, partial [Maribacter sp.]|nr:helix-turn-helix domain-containing protein [Maribacter sp.]